jgi:hypothetical protein
MFWAAHHSSSGALTVFAASGLHTHVVTGRSQIWVGTDYGRSPHAYVNQRLKRQSSWWWAVCRLKHVEPLINGGIINSITRLHLVGYFSWVILQCTDPWILNLLYLLQEKQRSSRSWTVDHSSDDIAVWRPSGGTHHLCPPPSLHNIDPALCDQPVCSEDKECAVVGTGRQRQGILDCEHTPVR